MKRSLGLFAASSFMAVPMLMAQEPSDHVEVGAFVNYYRMSDPAPTRNFIALGGRAAFAIAPSIQRKPRWLTTSSGTIPTPSPMA
jgi:hypothetical protein